MIGRGRATVAGLVGLALLGAGCRLPILTHYLNTVYFGHGAYGIQAAAKTYFSEPVTKLNLPQAALLAGLVQAPSDYEPIDHPRLARKRRNIVLRKMMQYGKISMRRYSAAVK